MSDHTTNQIVPHGTVGSYIIGFLLSLILTLSAYILAMIHITSHHETLPHSILLPLLVGFAFLQLIVQMIFFLHLLHESKPRWNLLFFVATFSLVLLVVIASMWIMQHLNYNMTPSEMLQYAKNQQGF